MILEKIKTPGLAHFSYFLASEGAACVVDPRRDVEAYLGLADRHGARITHVFETHRNEDLISGAPVLAARTGARVLHGPNPDAPVAYAVTTREGDSHTIGQARVDVLETPGHTDDSISLVLYDCAYDDGPVGVFTGDALFVGDVGRTDFYPDRRREVAGLLFDSLQKLLALGDSAIVYPAHGAGSVCGSDMADREFSTLGHERRNNPRLALGDRDVFIDSKVAEHHYQPPYFRLMEALNVEGSPALDPNRPLAPISAATLVANSEDSAAPDGDGSPTLVDVRSIHAFNGAHIPGSLALPIGMIAAFAGWLLSPRAPLVLVASDADEAREAARRLARIGFDDVRGYVAGPMAAATAGHPVADLPIVPVDTVESRLRSAGGDWVLLDVRGIDEYETAHIEGARHVYVGELPDRLAGLDPRSSYTTLCATGARATIAAALLEAHGFAHVDVCLGSMQAWQATGRPVVRGC